jgi:hypothetical protein
VVTVPVVAATVMLTVGAWWLSAPLAGRLDRGRRATFATLVASAPILPVTMLREGGFGGFRNPVSWLTEWSDLAGRMSGSQFALNVALFVPAGLAWGLLLRRWGVVAAGLAVASLLIETVQSIFGLGAADVTDLIANTTGAGLGVLGAIALASTVPHSVGGTLSTRQRAVTLACTAAVLLAAWLGVTLLSTRSTASLEDDLRAAFEGTDRADIAPAISGQTDDPEALFGRIDTRPDYIIQVEQSTVIEGRYSAPVLWMRRCVFVQWDDHGVRFDRGSGDDCTVFHDHLDVSTMRDMGG